MDCSTPGFPVINNPRARSNSCPLSQWCHPTTHPLSSPSPPAFSLFQNQGLFQWVSSSHQVAEVLKFQLQHQSFNEYSGLISFGIDWFDLLAVQGTLKGLQHHSSKAPILLHPAFFTVQLLHPYQYNFILSWFYLQRLIPKWNNIHRYQGWGL